jgi:hypothetical protein
MDEFYDGLLIHPDHRKKIVELFGVPGEILDAASEFEKSKLALRKSYEDAFDSHVEQVKVVVEEFTAILLTDTPDAYGTVITPEAIADLVDPNRKITLGRELEQQCLEAEISKAMTAKLLEMERDLLIYGNSYTGIARKSRASKVPEMWDDSQEL